MKFGSLLIFLCCGWQLLSQTPGSHYGISLGGNRANVTVPDDSTLNFTGSITLEAWIKVDSFKPSGVSNLIISKHGSRGGYDLRCNPNRTAQFRFGTSSGWKTLASNKRLNTGEWYHIAGTYDGDTMSLYINGKLSKRRFDTASLGIASRLPLMIGQYSKFGPISTGGKNFDGEIDEVRIWSTAVSKETIRNWTCRKVNAYHPNIKDLRGNWRFDEGSGSTAFDYSPHQNNGTLYRAIHRRSMAPIGDTSIFEYGTELKYTTASGDQLELRFSGFQKELFLYRVAEPSIDQLRNGFIFKDNQYFGVFAADASSLSYDFTYIYNGSNPFTSSGNCFVDMLEKRLRSDEYLVKTNMTHYSAGDSLAGSSTAHELHLGKYFDHRGVFIKNNDSVLCDLDVTRLTAYGDSTFGFQWYRNDTLLLGDTNAFLILRKAGKYRVDAVRNSTCQYKGRDTEMEFLTLPTVALSPIAPVCDYSDTFVLGGATPAGGYFSGWPVVYDSVIIPPLFGAGDYDIMYTYTDSVGCAATDTQNLHISKKPNASFKTNFSVCNGVDTLHLNIGRPKNGIYHGQGADGSIFYLDSINRKTGTYDLLYVYSDTIGCSDSATGKISVFPSPKIQFTPVKDTCENVAQFKLKSTPLGLFFGNGVKNGQFSPALAGPGLHLLTCSTTNKWDCSASDTQRVEVFKADKASLTFSDSICINGDSLQVSGGLPLGGKYATNGVVGNRYFKAQQVKAAGLYPVQYVYTNSNRCSDTATAQVKVLDTISIQIPEKTKVCNDGDTLQLNMAMPTGGTYTQNQKDISFFVPKTKTPGIYLVSYRLTGPNGCMSQRTFDIEVRSPSSVSIAKLEPICSNSPSFEITDFSPKGGQLSGLGIDGSFFDPKLVDVGNNWIRYTVIDSYKCMATDSLQIEVLSAPTFVFQFSEDHCENATPLLLDGQISPKGGSYFVNGLPSKTLFPASLSLGTHSLSYAYAASNGCSDSVSQAFAIHQAPDAPTLSVSGNTLISSLDSSLQWWYQGSKIDNATQKEFIADKEGYYQASTSNEYCESFSDSFYFQINGLPQIGGSHFSLFPNPTSDRVTVTGMALDQTYSFSILSISGQVLWESTSAGQSVLDLHFEHILETGSYVFLISDQHDQLTRFNLVIY